MLENQKFACSVTDEIFTFETHKLMGRSLEHCASSCRGLEWPLRASVQVSGISFFYKFPEWGRMSATFCHFTLRQTVTR